MESGLMKKELCYAEILTSTTGFLWVGPPHCPECPLSRSHGLAEWVGEIWMKEESHINSILTRRRAVPAEKQTGS
ncbi:hypothetical protein evm_007674 [Chilo suppressalis]|nr:hypothetical protein evm_007674 [Chilo suppressalis]